MKIRQTKKLTKMVDRLVILSVYLLAETDQTGQYDMSSSLSSSSWPPPPPPQPSSSSPPSSSLFVCIPQNLINHLIWIGTSLCFATFSGAIRRYRTVLNVITSLILF